jgi:hypothetical protein
MNEHKKFVLLLVILLASIALLSIVREQIGVPFVDQLQG